MADLAVADDGPRIAHSTGGSSKVGLLLRTFDKALWVFDLDTADLMAGVRQVCGVTIIVTLAVMGALIVGHRTGVKAAKQETCVIVCQRQASTKHWTWDDKVACQCLVPASNGGR